MLIDLICHTKSESDLFLNIRNLLKESVKPVFEYKITFEFVFYCCEFTKIIVCSEKSWCEMFLLKLFSIPVLYLKRVRWIFAHLGPGNIGNPKALSLSCCFVFLFKVRCPSINHCSSSIC